MTSENNILKSYPREIVDLHNIQFDDDNPNEMTETELQSLDFSMEKWGYIDPIVIDQNYKIANGEHRAKVLLERGNSLVEVIKYNFADDNERRLFRQTMNKLKGQHNLKKDIPEMEMLLRNNSIDLKGLLNFDEQALNSLRKRAAEEENALQKLLKPEKEDDIVIPNQIIDKELKTIHTCPKCGYVY